MNIPVVIGNVFGVAIALTALGALPHCAYAQAAAGSNVIMLLRFAGDGGTTPQLRSCLTSRLSKMPDTEVAAAPMDGVRFVVDIIVAKCAGEHLSASLVVAETFPLEQFRPRIAQRACGDRPGTNSWSRSSI